MKENPEDLDGKDIQNEEMSEDAQEEDSTNDEYDQDSSISFEDDADSTSSQEDEMEEWIEYIKRTQDLSSRQDLKEKQEDQPRDGKMTRTSL